MITWVNFRILIFKIFSLISLRITFFITGRNEVVAKVIFLHLSVIHSVHRGEGSASVHAGMPPPPRADPPSRHTTTPLPDTPREQTPPGSRPPREQTPPILEQTPPPGADPPEADSSIRSTSGRFASYWNAFLFIISLHHSVFITKLSSFLQQMFLAMFRV